MDRTLRAKYEILLYIFLKIFFTFSEITRTVQSVVKYQPSSRVKLL